MPWFFGDNVYTYQQQPFPIIAKYVSVNECGSLIMDHDGRVYGVGVDVWGNLGLGNLGICSDLPKLITDFPVKFIECGLEHSAIIDVNGRVLTFGNGEHHKLGLGHDFDELSPTLVDKLPPAVAVACGTNHTAVLTVDAEVYVFGCNKLGQLGVGHLNNTQMSLHYDCDGFAATTHMVLQDIRA